MTEQELLQENEKLKARLQKAITVFGEQKANIQRLTEERDSARKELTKANERITELEELTAKNDENDTKFFEQVQEIEDLSAAKKSLEESLSKTESTLKTTEEQLQNTTADLAAAEKREDELKHSVLTMRTDLSDMRERAKEALQELSKIIAG